MIKEFKTSNGTFKIGELVGISFDYENGYGIGIIEKINKAKDSDLTTAHIKLEYFINSYGYENWTKMNDCNQIVGINHIIKVTGIQEKIEDYIKELQEKLDNRKSMLEYLNGVQNELSYN